MFFQNLVNLQYEQYEGPGGHQQWRPVGRDDIQMLTSDLALYEDPAYKVIVEEFAKDLTALETEFKHAWYKLMSRDMGPRVRCKGTKVPPAEPFQNPLPDQPAKLEDFKPIKESIKEILNGDSDTQFIHLAYQCTSAFRITDYQGGCNGARIRFPPQNTWVGNQNLDGIFAVLTPIKTKFAGISWADLIILAGQVALEKAGASDLDFYGGRVDAADGVGYENYKPRTYVLDPVVSVRDNFKVMGLSTDYGVALFGRPKSAFQFKAMGLTGTILNTDNTLSNSYFKTLLSETWVASADGNSFKAEGKDLVITKDEHALIIDPEFKKVVQKFADSEDVFKNTFSKAWSALVNADSFNQFRNGKGEAPDPIGAAGTVGQSLWIAAITGAGVFLL
jgi:catalase (peroxidase I)